MTDTYVSYAPGAGTLLARGERFLLVDVPASHPGVSALWTAVERAGSAAELLGALDATLPDVRFCLVEATADRVALAQHGVAATLDGRPVVAHRSPVEVGVPDVGGMVIAATEAVSGLQLPIEVGVVAAGAVYVVQVGDVPLPEPEPEPAPEPEPEPEPEPVVAHRDPSGAIVAPPPTVGDAPVPPSAAEQPGAGIETVLAGICLNGHTSGAYAPTCRVCGDPMPQQTPRTILRPPLGVLELEDGGSVELDKGAILGRAPRVPEDATEEPHLVNLAAYGRDVSRQHVEVVVHGWNVFARDLGSSNGTRLLGVDGGESALEPGVAVQLSPGDALEIAEVTTVRFRTA